MTLFCGIDWAETHHDVAIIDGDGQLVARKRITDDPAGFAQLVEMLADTGDSTERPAPGAIETPRARTSTSSAGHLRRCSRPIQTTRSSRASRGGPANSTGARVLAEIGDDRTRFADARALKAYAGSAPVTRASGRSIS